MFVWGGYGKHIQGDIRKRSEGIEYKAPLLVGCTVQYDTGMWGNDAKNNLD